MSLRVQPLAFRPLSTPPATVSNKMTPPDPGPRGYVFRRDARPGRFLTCKEADRLFVKSLRAVYTPIGYNSVKWQPSQAKTKASPENTSPPETQPREPCTSPSPNPAAAAETSWEGRGALPVIIPRIVRSQCSKKCSDVVGTPKCGFRFVSEKKYQAHWMEAHQVEYSNIRRLLKNPRFRDNQYLPRRRPKREPGDGLMEKKVTEGPDREMLFLTELRREGRLSTFDLEEGL